MTPPRVVSREAWLAARRELLAREKAFTRERDALSAARRELPWVEVSKPYAFEGPAGGAAAGKQSLAELFDGRSQLVVYHFMFGPDWEEGCKSCSFWADSYDRNVVHLAHRDVSLVGISRAPLDKLDAYRRRMGWTFPWYSSLACDFNQDFQVSFTPEQIEKGKVTYNFAPGSFPSDEAPGLSVFAREGDRVYHTYSCYARGLDMLNSAYQVLDLVPKGRDEDALPYPMDWLRHRDRYEDAGR